MNTNLEIRSLKLGFLPLLDCAPLVVARELGFFAEQGLEVVLSREANWASVRDKVAVGLLDGAQMLAPMPLASTLGLGAPKVPMLTALALSRNGNAITIEQGLFHYLDEQTGASRNPRILGDALRNYMNQCSVPLTLATVYPHSCHHYQLRYWLDACGIDPDRDLRLVAIPPQKMLGHLRAGDIQGYCVGEPWNSLAEIEGTGQILTTGYQIWPNAIEKVLGVTRHWAELHPGTHEALVRALIQACRWLDAPENQLRTLELLGLPPYLDRVAGQLQQGSYPRPGIGDHLHQQFFGADTNVPWHAQGLWLLEQMKQAGQWAGGEAEPLIQQVYRPDIFRAAAATLGMEPPLGQYTAFDAWPTVPTDARTAPQWKPAG